MQTDLDLFRQFETSPLLSILRIYAWKPKCISLGYGQKIEDEIKLAEAKATGWDIVKRPTGGGIVFHNEAEVTYSLITAIDNPLLPRGMIHSYKKISEALIDGLALIGIKAELKSKKFEHRTSHTVPAGRQVEHRTLNTGLCFSYPAEYEVVVKGKKIVGSAQKRGRRALLQQGSIFVRNTDPAVFSLLKKPAEAYNAISVEELLRREIGFNEMSQALIKGFEECFNIKLKS